MQGLSSGAVSEEELGREGSGPMALGSEKVTDTDEGDEMVGISKSGSKVETVGMLSSLGTLASRCDGERDGGREFGAVHDSEAEDTSKHS